MAEKGVKYWRDSLQEGMSRIVSSSYGMNLSFAEDSLV